MPIPAPGPIQALPTAVTGFVGAADTGPLDSPVTVSSAADYHATFGPSLGPDRPLGHALDLFFANGGRSAVVVRATGPAPEQLVPPTGPGGVHALDGSGTTVLVLPGLTADHPEQVRTALGRCAAYRAVLVLDLPPGPWTPTTQARLDEVGEHRERVAAYHPWVVVDGLPVPPGGAVAGVIARTDAERGVWSSPAGVELRGVEGLSEALDGQQGEELTGAGVNPLRDVPGRGTVVWGARTLAGVETADPAGRYLAVRRLTDHVLTSVAVGLQQLVQDRPSDAALWARARQLTEDFLRGLWRQGAFVGTKEDQAFGARCGPGETMREADVRAGRVLVSLWTAPLRPAEFEVHTLGFQAAAASSSPRAVDLNRVVSRYMRQTGKNVGRLLDEAERSGSVLWFDEADAFFGRRAGRRGPSRPRSGKEPDGPEVR